MLTNVISQIAAIGAVMNLGQKRIKMRKIK